MKNQNLTPSELRDITLDELMERIDAQDTWDTDEIKELIRRAAFVCDDFDLADYDDPDDVYKDCIIALNYKP